MKVPENKYLFYVEIDDDDFPGNDDVESWAQVTINTVACWEANCHLCDHYTEEEWNDLTPVLKELGLGERQESVYEVEGDETPEEITEKLLGRGFIQSESFDKFLGRCKRALK